jgi:hypothetical protein
MVARPAAAAQVIRTGFLGQELPPDVVSSRPGVLEPDARRVESQLLRLALALLPALLVALLRALQSIGSALRALGPQRLGLLLLLGCQHLVDLLVQPGADDGQVCFDRRGLCDASAHFVLVHRNAGDRRVLRVAGCPEFRVERLEFAAARGDDPTDLLPLRVCQVELSEGKTGRAGRQATEGTAPAVTAAFKVLRQGWRRERGHEAEAHHPGH